MTPVSVLISSWSNHIPVHYIAYVESDVKLVFQNIVRDTNMHMEIMTYKQFTEYPIQID